MSVLNSLNSLARAALTAALAMGEFSPPPGARAMSLSRFARDIRKPEKSDPARAKRERRNRRRLSEAAVGGWRR